MRISSSTNQENANSKSAMPPKIFKTPILGVVLKWIFLAFCALCAMLPSCQSAQKMYAKVQEVAATSKFEISTLGGLAPIFDPQIPVSVASKVEPHGPHATAQIVRVTCTQFPENWNFKIFFDRPYLQNRKQCTLA